MKIPGIKGWEAKFITEDDGLSGDIKAHLIAVRTNTGKWTDEDEWMLKHGKEYLTRILTSAYKNLGHPE